MSLHYLTVQDVLWINFQMTKAVQPFSYANLEEATFYQYGYGQSQNLFPQAARFLTGFLKKRPLKAGNEATALIAFLGFLEINGYTLDLPDTIAWFKGVERGENEVLPALESSAKADEHAHHDLVPDVRAKLGELLEKYGDELASLQAASV